MIDPDDPNPQFVDSIFHPSDFSGGSANAFAHALAIALHRKSEFTVLHTDASPDRDNAWERYPGIRETLERWGELPKGSPRSAVFRKLGIRAQKIAVRTKDTAGVIAEYLDENPTDLIVLSTRGKDGLPSWLDMSVAERIARKTQSMTLFVPNAAKGFVSQKTGEVSLRRILIAVDEEPPPSAAIAFACRAAKMLGEATVDIALLHVGAESEFPRVDLESDPAWRIGKKTRKGAVVDAILDEAKEFSPDLIVMTTVGRQGFLDAFRGSTTEQVLRRSKCPLLAVPGYDADADR